MKNITIAPRTLEYMDVVSDSDVTLLVGGHIYSPSHPDATALATCGEIICWIGSDDVGRERFPHAHHQDLDGAWVAPGFVDSHAHISEIGLWCEGLDLSGAQSSQQCLKLIREYAHSHSGLLWGYGWDETTWGQNEVIQRDQLDEATQGKMGFFVHRDRLRALVSTSLSHQAIRIDPEWSNQPYAVVTGTDYDRLYQVALDQLDPNQRRQVHHASLDRAAASGIVAVHECGSPGGAGREDFTLLCSNQYPIDVMGYWAQLVDTPSQARELLDSTGAKGLAGEIWIDGSLESSDAWLTRSYEDQPHHSGHCYVSATQVLDHVCACTEAGICAGFHVVGDQAITMVIEVFSTLVDRYGIGPVAHCGHRLEQVSMITPEQAGLLGRWGIKCSICPSFYYQDQHHTHRYAHRLGSERTKRMYPLMSLTHAGVPISLGFDSPDRPFNPWESVYAATHHPDRECSLSMRGAFTAATRGGWRVGGVDDELTGTLVPGAPASYVIWEVDELGVSVPRNSVQRWSMNPNSRVAPLPVLTTPGQYPRCRQTVHRGQRLYG